MNLGIKLLVAEDDINLGTILKAYLTQKGYTVFWAQDGQQAIDSYQADDVDACILDIMMPEKDGYTIAREIRRMDKKTPIIFLSAKNLEADKLKGFEVGADDYVTKPFSMEELLARLNATIRRSFNDGKPDKNIFHLGNITFDYQRQVMETPAIDKKLTQKECELLRVFAINFNQIVDRQSTLQKIWKDDSYFAARSMDVYITKLRKYFKELDPRVQIVNVHGVGFRLTIVTE